MKRIYYAALHRPLPGMRPEIDLSSIFEARSLVRWYVERQQHERNGKPYDFVRIAKVRIEEVRGK